MPIRINLTNLRQTKKQSTERFLIGTKPVMDLFRCGTCLKYLKKYLPIIITILILIIGLVIGKRIASRNNQSIDIPKPAALPSTITPSVDSSLTQLKQSIIQYNPQLPDPLMPEFNDSILLEDLEE